MNVVLVRNDALVFRDKEVMIVGLLAEDHTVTEIASKQNMKVRGLEGTVAAMKRKIGCKTIHGLVAYFLRNGLIE